MISRQDIYVYYHKTSTNILLAGYSSPAGVLYNTNVTADPKGDEDVSPPFGDPMDADLSASSSWSIHHRVPANGSIVAFLEPYVQQITASITNMDTCLLALMIVIQHKVCL